MNTDPDHDAWVRSKQGDFTAAGELIERHYLRIFAYFRRQCGREADAADLTQKTFCKFWASIDTFEGRSSVATWIHSIAWRVWVDFLRQRHPSEPLPAEWWIDAVDPQKSPSQVLVDKESNDRVHAAVARLPEALRQTVHLHYYQGLSLAETAQVMSVATSTVKYRLREALEQLKSSTREKNLSPCKP